MNRKKYSTLFFFCLAIIACQLLLKAAGKDYFLTQMTMSAYYSLVVLGLCLLMGFAGQISLGQAGFFALGGYASAILTTYNLKPLAANPLIVKLTAMGVLTGEQNIYGSEILHLAPWIAFIAAILLTLAVAIIIGTPVLKLKGHYLAMATLGFGLIIYKIALATPVFGQADGISDIPGLKLLFGLEISGKSSLRIQNYYIAWFCVAAGVIILENLVNSRAGRAWRSLHGGEEAAETAGIDTAKYKIYAFVISALYAAAGGILLTHFNNGIGPSEATISKSVRYVAIVALGGMDNIWSSLLTAVALNFLSLRGYFGSYDDLVFGIILVSIMLFVPGGLFGAFSKKRKNASASGK